MTIWTQYDNIFFGVSKNWVNSVAITWCFIPATFTALAVI
jgi:hypothetical protein